VANRTFARTRRDARSRDEEHVEFEEERAGRTFDLGSRSLYDPLLNPSLREIDKQRRGHAGGVVRTNNETSDGSARAAS
jgi:hypothetical protein